MDGESRSGAAGCMLMAAEYTHIIEAHDHINVSGGPLHQPSFQLRVIVFDSIYFIDVKVCDR